MQSKGFTVMELLLSISIIGILSALSIPLYFQIASQDRLSAAADATHALVSRANLYAKKTYQNSAWGIHVGGGEAVLYRGPVFASRDTGFDEVVAIPTGITTSGLSDLYFDKLTGRPNVTGGIIFQNGTSGTRSITINSMGMVSNE